MNFISKRKHGKSELRKIVQKMFELHFTFILGFEKRWLREVPDTVAGANNFFYIFDPFCHVFSTPAIENGSGSKDPNSFRKADEA